MCFLPMGKASKRVIVTEWDPWCVIHTVKSRYYEQHNNEFLKFTNVLKTATRWPIF